MRQMLTESLVLALPGGLAGIGIASATTRRAELTLNLVPANMFGFCSEADEA